MAADITLLKGTGGELMEDSRSQDGSVERMLVGFLRALLDEQKPSARELESNSNRALLWQKGGKA